MNMKELTVRNVFKDFIYRTMSVKNSISHVWSLIISIRDARHVPMENILQARIRAEGPISVADYMSECLGHPKHGYYITRDPLGAEGDFTTAPEISQMFGEMLGLCLAQAWLDQGAPSPFTLAELGPGRGTLMADILR